MVWQDCWDVQAHCNLRRSSVYLAHTGKTPYTSTFSHTDNKPCACPKVIYILIRSLNMVKFTFRHVSILKKRYFVITRFCIITNSVLYRSIYLYLFIIFDPLSSVIKIECTWCVSIISIKRRKSETVQIKKFKSKLKKR